MFLRGQQTQVITMRREQLSQLPWDNPPPPTTCTTARRSMLVRGPRTAWQGERPSLTDSKAIPVISPLPLGGRADVCEAEEPRDLVPGLGYRSHPNRATFPTAGPSRGLPTTSASWSSGRARRLCGSQARVRPVGGSRELTVSSRTEVNAVTLR